MPERIELGLALRGARLRCRGRGAKLLNLLQVSDAQLLHSLAPASELRLVLGLAFAPTRVRGVLPSPATQMD